MHKGDINMKKLYVFLLVSALLLVGCASDEYATGNETEKNNSEETNETDDNNSNVEEEVEFDPYNGFVPRDEMEEKYFDAISDLWNWNSFVNQYSYNTYLSDPDDMPLEINELSRYVLEPFQLYTDYHSIFLRVDFFERYVTEDGAYINEQMGEWVEDEYYQNYNKNPLLSRMDLFYNMIVNSWGIAEFDDGTVALDIMPESLESIYEQLYLAYHHDLRLNSEEYQTEFESLYVPLEGLEGISVEFKFDNNILSKVTIYISYNRTDEITVDQIHIIEEYSEVNEFDSIEIPAEVRGS
jgi:hypothetical protein